MLDVPVFKKAYEIVQREQNKALGWYVYTMYFTDFLQEIRQTFK